MTEKANYLSELNSVQREAVLATEGPVLVVAGAGSGKTRVLIYRMLHLILGKQVNPANLLGVTFTNRAAEEMRSRIRKSLGELADRIWIATFHSTCAQILRQEIHRLGYSRNFVIYDEEDSLSLIKQVMKEKNLDEKSLHPKWVRAWLERVKREMRLLDALEGEGGTQAMLAGIYQAYQEALKRANALDFTDLLILTLKLFEQSKEVLAKYQERFRYIMVDEYQDTNLPQYLLVQHLARKYQNICVVGDEDQSIYRWRGANIENILNFTRDFPSARVIKLTQNYRSTGRIIESASHLISHNQKRIPKQLWTQNPEGEKIRLIECADETEEAERVVETILRLKAGKRSYSDFAVFYRVHAQSRPLEDEFRAQGIPYQIFGGLRFYERKEIKDLLAYLRLLINPDDSVSLLRVINNPPRGIGPATIEQLNHLAQRQNLSLFQAMNFSLSAPEFSERSKKSLKEFLKLLAEIKSEWEKEGSLKELFQFVMEKTGYLEELSREGTVEAESRIENLEELLNAVSEYEQKEKEPTLEGFLEKTALFQDTDQFSEEGLCTLMTLHSAKGLEFPIVLIVGLEEGLFPHIRALEEEEEEELEEERRLFYVGMTRAKEQLILFYAHHRKMRGQAFATEPSRFLSELPEEHLKLEHPKRLKMIAFEERRKRKGKKAEREQELETLEEEIEVWDSERELSWRAGLKVRHPNFGEGVIEKVEGSEDKIKLVVRFQSVGKKKLLAKFAKLEIVG